MALFTDAAPKNTSAQEYVHFEQAMAKEKESSYPSGLRKESPIIVSDDSVECDKVNCGATPVPIATSPTKHRAVVTLSGEDPGTAYGVGECDQQPETPGESVPTIDSGNSSIGPKEPSPVTQRPCDTESTGHSVHAEAAGGSTFNAEGLRTSTRMRKPTVKVAPKK